MHRRGKPIAYLTTDHIEQSGHEPWCLMCMGVFSTFEDLTHWHLEVYGCPKDATRDVVIHLPAAAEIRARREFAPDQRAS